MHLVQKSLWALMGSALVIASGAFVATSAAGAAAAPGGDAAKYNVKVPGGLAFSEFKGFEAWEVVSVSHSGSVLAVTVANPTMIKAYKDGIPANGKPVPDGAKMAKMHWIAKTSETYPAATVPGTQRDVDFMVKDSKRFGKDGGWGYAAFAYDAASDSFSPSTLASNPPQGNDAKCGVACHTIVQSRDYVFTEYAHR